MGRWIYGLALAGALSLGLPAAAQDTGDTGGSTDGGSTDGGTTDGGTTDGGTTEQTEDTAVHVPGLGAAELAGEEGGCQSVLGGGAAALFLVFGLGALTRRGER